MVQSVDRRMAMYVEPGLSPGFELEVGAPLNPPSATVSGLFDARVFKHLEMV